MPNRSPFIAKRPEKAVLATRGRMGWMSAEPYWIRLATDFTWASGTALLVRGKATQRRGQVWRRCIEYVHWHA